MGFLVAMHQVMIRGFHQLKRLGIVCQINYGKILRKSIIGCARKLFTSLGDLYDPGKTVNFPLDLPAHLQDCLADREMEVRSVLWY